MAGDDEAAVSGVHLYPGNGHDRFGRDCWGILSASILIRYWESEMNYLIYGLVLIGACTVVRWAGTAIRTLHNDLRSKPTPWLGLPWGML
jgi:hypothetical protein